jgi:excisionase family DNA binding protein
MLNELDTILLPDEVAQVLKISTGEVYRLLRNREISAYRVGKTWRIPKENLETYIKSKIPTQNKSGSLFKAP